MTEIIQYKDIGVWLMRLEQQHAEVVDSGWHFARTLHAGIEQFGRTDPKRMELYEMAANQTGLTVRYLQNMVSMFRSPAAAIATELNEEHGASLTILHARNVLGLEEDVARSYLTDAIEQRWTPEMLSRTVWENRKATHNTMNDITPPVVAQNGASASATRHLSEMISDVNRSKVITTIGATLRPNMTEKESVALATYGHVTSDMLNWTRGDHYNRIEDDTQQLARRKGWKLPEIEKYLEDRLDELSRAYQTDSDTILRNAATCRAFEKRTQTQTIGYAHHELLCRMPLSIALEHLDLAERNGWTVQQLDKHLHPHPSVSDEVLGIIKHADTLVVHGNTITIDSGKLRLFITAWRIEAT